MKNEEILKALGTRYATKVFDPSKKVSDADLNTILESGRLSPSSFGLEPWKFIVVTNPAVRSQIRAVGWDQPQMTDASHLLVIARRTDASSLSPELIARTAKAQGKTEADLAGFKDMVDGSIAAKSAHAGAVDSWLKAQTYIPLGIMLETAALIGVDACPMEGFDPEQVDKILGLKARNLASTTLLAIGYRGDDSYATKAKARRTSAEAIEFVA